MTDIVERLRKPDWWLCGHNHADGSIDDDSIEGNPLPYEAADTIDELVVALKSIKNIAARPAVIQIAHEALRKAGVKDD